MLFWFSFGQWIKLIHIRLFFVIENMLDIFVIHSVNFFVLR
jgi:hypothetical protein